MTPRGKGQAKRNAIKKRDLIINKALEKRHRIIEDAEHKYDRLAAPLYKARNDIMYAALREFDTIKVLANSECARKLKELQDAPND